MKKHQKLSSDELDAATRESIERITREANAFALALGEFAELEKRNRGIGNAAFSRGIMILAGAQLASVLAAAKPRDREMILDGLLHQLMSTTDQAYAQAQTYAALREMRGGR